MSEQKTNLDIAIEWIYAHVATEHARKKLHHEIVTSESNVGPFVIVQRFLVFTFEGRKVEMWVRHILEQPNNVDRILLRLHDEALVPIIFEWFEHPGDPPQAIDPIGPAWPEKSAELGIDAYHTKGGSIREGEQWEDKRGIFIARRKERFFMGLFTYWLWERVKV